MQELLGSLGGVGVIGGIVILVAAAFVVWAINSLIIIVPPNEAAVITGRKRKLPDGRLVGYRTVIGGSTLRIPIIERVQHLSLETIPLELTVSNAFSKGNIPLTVQAIANVKIASEPETDFTNAVERLLGKREGEVADLARETLMGNLRGVLATLTPEEINENRLKFAESLAAEAEEDLKKLGFSLDVLKIQNVSDEAGYLDAIGRKKTAVVKKEAEVAEAENAAETRRMQAEYRQQAETAEAAAAIQIAEAKNRLRVRQAELARDAETAERLAMVAAEQAEIEARRALEEKRVETERQRLTADVVAPAEADRQAAEARAKAAAAPIMETGYAQAEVLRVLREQIESGPEGFAIFMAEKLPQLLGLTTEAVKDMDVDLLIVVDSGDGRGLANAANQKVNAAVAMLEQFAATYGVGIEDVLRETAHRVGPGVRRPGAETVPAGGAD